MLDKWDAMDEIAVHGQPQQEGEGDSVREYEMWEPERERIRLAQVQIERQLEEAESVRQTVKEEEKVHCDHSLDIKNQLKGRKASPKFVVDGPDHDLYELNGGRSVATSLASTLDPTAPSVDGGAWAEPVWSNWHQPTLPARPVAAAVSPTLPRLLPLLPTANPSGPHQIPTSPFAPVATHLVRALRLPTLTLSTSTSLSLIPSPRRPRGPPSPNAQTPFPAHTPRSPGESPSPPPGTDADIDTDEPGGRAGVLSATATAGRAAAEQLGEAVTSALSRDLPSFFAGRVYP
ncbi:hypothetical protein JCM1841_003921 [Sporobolomyces salmonicolor]